MKLKFNLIHILLIKSFQHNNSHTVCASVYNLNIQIDQGNDQTGEYAIFTPEKSPDHEYLSKCN